MCFKDDPRAFLWCASFRILFHEQAGCLVFRDFVLLLVSSAEPELVMDFEPTVCHSPADVDVVCVAPKKKLRAPSHIWTDEETCGRLSFLNCPQLQRSSSPLNSYRGAQFSSTKMTLCYHQKHSLTVFGDKLWLECNLSLTKLRLLLAGVPAFTHMTLRYYSFPNIL